jgi:hypothetical protein
MHLSPAKSGGAVDYRRFCVPRFGIRAAKPPATGSAGAALLPLQRGAGNRAVADLLQRTGQAATAAALGVVQWQAQQSPVQLQAPTPKLRTARQPRRPTPLQNLKASVIGTKIRDGLAGLGVPVSDGGVRPFVNPDKVLDILATSRSFREDAAIAQRRNPNLTFDFHALVTRGTFTKTEGEKTTIVVHVTEIITEVVRGVVHEVRHASRSAPPPTLSKNIGDITRTEMRGVEEELDTRSRENEIMLELIDAGSLLGRDVKGTSDDPAQVRAAFRSGDPKMTYQEKFIVEAMQEENRVSSLTEEKLQLAEGLARALVPANLNDKLEAVPVPPSTESLGRFTINPAELRKTAKRPAEPELPDEKVAVGWVNDYFTRAFVGSGGRPESIPDAPMEAKPFLIRLFRLYGYKPSEDVVKSQLRVWRKISASRNLALGLAQSVTPGFDELLGDMPKADRDRAVRFVEWVMIAEAIGRDWGAATTADNKTRRRHLDFLARRLGGKLLGIERP